MKLVMNIPDYVKEQADAGKGEELGIPLWLAYEIANGIPYETVTEFAARCRECGAKYGKMFKQEQTDTWSIKDVADALARHGLIVEQKPCGDAINRQWLMECVNEGWIKFDTEKDKNKFIHLVRDMAPQPKTGHWIDMDEGFSPCECSECKSVEFIKSKYCPNCGAKMVEPQESEDEG